MQTLFQDLRYGFRMLWNSPGFALVSLLTLALGIGANTAMFSVVNGILLRPLPYSAPDQLVKLWPGQPLASVSKAEYVELRKMRTLNGLAAFSTFTFTLTGKDEPEELKGGLVSASCFSVLGVKAMLGRSFLPNEDQPGSQVVLLSSGLWQRRFGGDRNIVGQSVTIDGDLHTIVGVMPPGLSFPAENMQLWVPMSIDPANAQDFTAGYLNLLGRLNPSVKKEQAQAELAAFARHLRDSLPGMPPTYGVNAAVNSLQQEMVGNIRPRLLVILSVVGMVLLIACANVANLQLAKITSRRKEIAIRAAHGASRARLFRQLLTESLLLALAGGAMGLLLAFLSKNLLISILPADTPRLSDIQIDLRVFGFTLASSVMTGVLFGLIPAFRLSKLELFGGLKEGGRTSLVGARSLYRSLLAISEIALALTLLIGAGLLVKSFWRLQEIDPGFRPDNVLSLRLAPPSAKYQTKPQKVAFYRRILERIEGLPGVTSAGAINLLPLGGSNWNFTVNIEGRPVATGTPTPRSDLRLVTADYFRTVGVALVKGRYFGALDNESAPKVAVINQTMAHRYWPSEDPVGKRVSNDENDWATIVGVVEDVKDRSLDQQARAEMYRPYFQVPWIVSLTMMIRAKSDLAGLASSIREVVWSIDKDVPVSDIQSLTEVVANSISAPRSTMLIIAGFALVAMLLGAVGICGVVGYSVTQRTHDIGIRLALGAKPGDVLRQVVGEGAVLTFLGVAIGIAAARGLARLMSSLLYDVRPADPAVFVIVSLFLACVALASSYIPARRASKVDPMVALRYE
jgi:putative ABC transport system permease protein